MSKAEVTGSVIMATTLLLVATALGSAPEVQNTWAPPHFGTLGGPDRADGHATGVWDKIYNTTVCACCRTRVWCKFVTRMRLRASAHARGGWHLARGNRSSKRNGIRHIFSNLRNNEPDSHIVLPDKTVHSWTHALCSESLFPNQASCMHTSHAFFLLPPT